MKILLDTHVFLWAKAQLHLLSAETLAMLADPGNAVFLSTASVWEIAIKHALGNLTLPSAPNRYIPLRMSESGIFALTILNEHALRAGSLPRHHGDPFDRLLVAQAQIEHMTIVSEDPKLRHYDVRIMKP